MNTRNTGNVGEALAIKYLKDQGFTIIETNFRIKLGEVDIIALKDDRVHFVEVKYRNSDRFGLGREAVTWTKQQTIRKVALAYLTKKGLYYKVDISFDVIEISGAPPNHVVEHFVACF